MRGGGRGLRRGGLPEYLPSGAQPVPVGDSAALARVFDRLADPEVAAAEGATARAHHGAHYAPAVAAAALVEAVSPWARARR